MAYINMPFIRCTEDFACVRGLVELMCQLCENNEIPAMVDFKLWCDRESYQN